MSHIADNHDALLDYLYEEGDATERLKIAKHLQECAACSVALLEFQNVRGMLRYWTPPGSALGFRLVQDSAFSPTSVASPTPSAAVNQGARTGAWLAWLPAPAPKIPWRQLGAAVLLFVGGMVVSQVTVGYEGGRMVVVSGRSARPAVNARASSITLPPQPVSDVTSPNPGVTPQSVPADRSPVDTELLLQRVRSMIDQSEQRQQRELALRLSQVTREVDTQHQADLLRIQQDFGHQQEATMEYLVRTSGGAK
jgi:anti-sigma factor RsiW